VSTNFTIEASRDCGSKPQRRRKHGRQKQDSPGGPGLWSGGASRSRTELNGFAIRGITALLTRRVTQEKGKPELPFSFEIGAGKESRTLDLNLGKVALYQLSYARIKP
jgi:hypothetical protein